MADTRLRSPNIDRDPLEERGFKFATKGELDDLTARLNLLEYGGLTADKLGGGTVSQQSIALAANGKVTAGSTADDGFVLDADGLRFYDGGVNTIDLTANGGTAKFTGEITASTITGGTFRTAASGQRIEMDEGDYDTISFYTGDGAETKQGAILVGADPDFIGLYFAAPKAGFDYANMALVSAKNGTASAYAGFQVETFDASNVLTSRFLIDADLGATFDSGIQFFIVDALDAIVLESDTRIRFSTQTGYLEVERLAASNNLQLQFTGPVSGTTAIAVDGPATGNQLNVQDQVGTTAQPISASAFNVVSGRDTKSNIKDRPAGALAKVKALRAVDYTRGDAEQVGFVAEELAEHFPEAIYRKVDGTPHSIDVMAVVAILTQAVQELSNGN